MPRNAADTDHANGCFEGEASYFLGASTRDEHFVRRQKRDVFGDASKEMTPRFTMPAGCNVFEEAAHEMSLNVLLISRA